MGLLLDFGQSNWSTRSCPTGAVVPETSPYVVPWRSLSDLDHRFGARVGMLWQTASLASTGTHSRRVEPHCSWSSVAEGNHPALLESARVVDLTGTGKGGENAVML